MKFDYLKHRGDLALCVVVEVGEQFINCEWMYLHDSVPEILEICSPSGVCFKVNVTGMVKSTPVTYSGETIKLCLISP